MKYKTFRNLAAVTVVSLIGGGLYLATREDDPPKLRHVPTPRHAPTPRTGLSGRTSTPPPTTASGLRATSPPIGALVAPGLRPIDKSILAFLQRPMSGAKVKDAFNTQPYKVNIYRDAGNVRANRLKIDLDRDERWDEKWTIEGPGQIKREVAPLDNETYTQTFHLTPAGWAVKTNATAAPAAAIPATSAVAPPRTATPALPAGDPLRAIDTRIIGLLTQGISGSKLKDAFPRDKTKVSLYRDAGHARVNRIKVDLDRDERWDEKWTIEQDASGRDKISRKISPRDDDNHTIERELRQGVWVKP
ncbi:MAG: hypothetical protein ACYTFT_03845 [Planctomycetota bacterium]|jgi:hypothetical protein